MRVSSPILPSWMGTLKSTRTSTRLPRRSTSDILRMGTGNRGSASTLLRVHERDGGIQHPVAEAPFVVVPGGHLYQRAPDDLGKRRVENRRRGVVIEVGRDQRLLVVFEDIPQVRFGSLFHRAIDLVYRSRPFRHEGKVDEVNSSVKQASESDLRD